MMSIQKIYVDEKGGGRLYIPQEIISKLGWKHHDRLVVIEKNEALFVLPENDYQKHEATA